MKRWLLFIILLGLLGGASRVAAWDLSRDYTVQASVTVLLSPPRLLFSWPGHPEATGYTIYKKQKDASGWGTPYAVLPRTATSFTDSAVAAGEAYDYSFVRSARRDTVDYDAYGYVYAGIEVPAVDYRGKVLLLTERSVEDSLLPELLRLERDMRGDGWLVVRRTVDSNDPVPTVKAIIRSVYDDDPEHLTSVLLFGHIPVPYSGSINPDGHPDHRGAWPADMYYADMDGIWTDDTVRTGAIKDQLERNKNIPGDGKFDQDIIPTDVELQIGRVDLANLPFFPYTEIELLRRYLDKNHAYRTGQFPDIRRGLIDDNFKEGYTEGFGGNGWRNFSALFGAERIDTGEFVPTFLPNGPISLLDSFYLWSFGCGPGNFRSASYVCHARDLANDTITVKTVFTMLFGSYFGDWDSENNFLRSALAANGYLLASCWAGRPFWYVQHMALGETIGYSTRLTQNNAGLYSVNPTFTFVARMVHIALMGDPTLRLHPFAAPSALMLSTNSRNTVDLRWTAPPKPVLGYNIYRARNGSEPFVRLNAEPVAETMFVDSLPVTGDNVRYMVRAVRLETSGGGTYYNLSAGVEQEIALSYLTLHDEITWLYPNPTEGRCMLEVRRGNATTVSVDVMDILGKRLWSTERSAESAILTMELDITGYAPGVYIVRIRRGEETVQRALMLR